MLPLRAGQHVLQHDLLTCTGPAGPPSCARSGGGCCRGPDFLDDGGDVGVGGAVAHGTGAKGEDAVDAGLEHAHALLSMAMTVWRSIRSWPLTTASAV